MNIALKLLLKDITSKLFTTVPGLGMQSVFFFFFSSILPPFPLSPPLALRETSLLENSFCDDSLL